MKATTEIEVRVSGARISNAEMQADGSCKLTLGELKQEAPNVTGIDKDALKLVEASKLSLNDKFMQYTPKEGTLAANIKNTLVDLIKSGELKDFWRPKMDPSFDETGDGICYVAGRKPAVGKSKDWWDATAKKLGMEMAIMPQHVAFVGVLIKKLVEQGMEVADAWYALCVDSKEIGHYWNTEDSKHELEVTGSREVCGFYDLGNVMKILKETYGEKEYWLAGGFFRVSSQVFPIADMEYDGPASFNHEFSVGLLVSNIP